MKKNILAICALTLVFSCKENSTQKAVSKRLFQKKLPIEKIGLIVKETSSSSKFIIGLLMTVFGINISIWGIILTFNPQLIG